eukprot:Awhi_evm1s5124
MKNMVLGVDNDYDTLYTLASGKPRTCTTTRICDWGTVQFHTPPAQMLKDWVLIRVSNVNKYDTLYSILTED